MGDDGGLNVHAIPLEMTNLLSSLKSEISRLARKEVKKEVEKLQAAVTRQRKEITSLRTELTQLKQAMKQTRRAAPPVPTDTGDSAAPKRRFSAARLVRQREKLGVSAAAFGKLIGVTGQTVYSWERGQSRPRAGQLEAIARVRKMKKSEAVQTVATASQPAE